MRKKRKAGTDSILSEASIGKSEEILNLYKEYYNMIRNGNDILPHWQEG